MDSHDDLARATGRLDDAYGHARAAGYQPGSAQMHELASAEQAYQRARLRHDRAQATGALDLPAADLDLKATSGTPAGAAEVEIDLRDTGGGPVHPERRTGL